MSDMQKHFVTFYSPGTFVSEETTKDIDAWDAKVAAKMARKISERYNAKPFGFRFTTRGRGSADLDSKVIKTSPMYWLGGKIATLAEVEARNDPSEEIVRANMRCNGIKRIIVNTNSWKHTAAFGDDDVLLDWRPTPSKDVGGYAGEEGVMDWRAASTAPENVEVNTKIDNERGVRNEQTLKRRGNLWWFPDGSMYVYYTPTHWAPLEPPQRTRSVVGK